MSNDPTETVRRYAVEVINSEATNDEATERVRLAEKYGADNVWRYDEVGDHFEITGFMAPFCMATRKSDNVKGVLTFQHSPRFYFDFTPS